MAMIFSLGTKSHDVFVFKNLVDSYKESNFKSLDELQNIVYSNSESEFDIDLYNNAVSLPAAQSVQFSFDISVSAKYKYGTFNGKNRYKDVSGIIDTNATYSKPINGWLTLDKSSNDYGLFSTLDDDTFYIAVKDFSPGLIVSDFRPLYYKLMSLQLSKYNSPSNDTCSAYSGVVSFKQAISDLVSGIKNKSVLSFNSLVDSKYFSLKTVTDAAYDAEMAASKISAFGKFLQGTSGQGIANKIVDEVPILSEVKSSGLSVYKSLNSIKESFSGLSDGDNPTSTRVEVANTISPASYTDDFDNYKLINDRDIFDTSEDFSSHRLSNDRETFNTGDDFVKLKPKYNNIEHIPKGYRGEFDSNKTASDLKIEMLNDSIQAIIYAIPSVTASDQSYKFNNVVCMLGCLQQPEQISYTVDSQYDTTGTRGSQAPYQFYNNTGQITLSFELKWHIDEVMESQTNLIYGPNMESRTLQTIAKMAEDFARPWDNGNGSIQPKLCKVILPSITEVGYINNVSITYSGDMTADIIDSAIKEDKDNGRLIQENEGSVGRTDYTYNMLTINFSLLVVRDIKLEMSANAGEFNLQLFESSYGVINEPAQIQTIEAETGDNTNMSVGQQASVQASMSPESTANATGGVCEQSTEAAQLAAEEAAKKAEAVEKAKASVRGISSAAQQVASGMQQADERPISR